jgi:hypothetical protein
MLTAEEDKICWLLLNLTKYVACLKGPVTPKQSFTARFDRIAERFF